MALRRLKSFQEGINELVELKEMLMLEMLSWKQVLSPEDFYAIPFINADGYHSKTVAYSIWHIIRIEDIMTTGNELKKQEIAAFLKSSI